MKTNLKILIYVLVVIVSVLVLALVAIGQGFSTDPHLVYQGF